jgi:hypothetical protein
VAAMTLSYLSSISLDKLLKPRRERHDTPSLGLAYYERNIMEPIYIEIERVSKELVETVLRVMQNGRTDIEKVSVLNSIVRNHIMDIMIPDDRDIADMSSEAVEDLKQLRTQLDAAIESGQHKTLNESKTRRFRFVIGDYVIRKVIKDYE